MKRIQRGLISRFAFHHVAANLLMAAMLLVGVFALLKLNTQFLPNFNIEIVSVNVVWNGASAEDIEKSITNPLEREFRDLDGLKKMDSASVSGATRIYIEFEQGSNMAKALEDVRERVTRVRNLPPDSEEPVVIRVARYERIASLVFTGPKDIAELRPLVREVEQELLDAGIAKIDIFGLPEEEIAVQIPLAKLADLNLTLAQVADRIAQRSQDIPAGTVAKSEIGRQLRSLNQRRSIKEFETLPILSDRQGRLIRLGDIAKIERRAQDDEIITLYQGKPAVEMRLLRTESANALSSANILHRWLTVKKPELGESVQVHVYDENWQYIQERIDLLLKNGFGGMMLIILILYLFLNRRVAFWVVIGIPASFMAAIAALYLAGGSINMVSLFAMIMSLGIIVDDTIVVGEQTLTNLHAGQHIREAVVNAAYKMLIPVSASSLTTICAFLPLFLISGIIGKILFAIPLVVICVIIASLLECFFVLPGHLYHSYRNKKQEREFVFREHFKVYFNKFRDGPYTRFIERSLHWRGVTICSALGAFLLALGVIIGGHIKFTFFPSPEGQMLIADVRFTVGTPAKKVDAFLKHLDNTLQATNAAIKANIGQDIVRTAVTFKNYARINNYQANQGEQYASKRIELLSPDNRRISNEEFIKAWKKRIKIPAGIEFFSVYATRGGPPGEDIDVLFTGSDPDTLKRAAVELANVLTTIPGVSDIKDDLPFGQKQLIYKLNVTGSALGLTTQSIGSQLRAAFNGRIAQIFHEPNEEIEVRVVLPDEERYTLATLEQFPVILPNSNRTVPLGTVVDLHFRAGPEILLHTDTKLGVHVTAKIDAKVNNTNAVVAQLQAKAIPDITARYNLKHSLRGKAEEQAETFADMRYGVLLGLILIYIILAWVFNSYTWPITVMLAIPLGLTGAIFGHYLMGIDLTILSIFGLFGLSGIVINDSIILITEFKLIRAQGISTNAAIVQASCNRLRAVLLTSLTTIAGLTPLLFERSLQAQFLIPMACSISFGLAYATILILIVVPTSLSLVEDLKSRLWINSVDQT